MERYLYYPSVTDFAREILDMKAEIEHWKSEAEHYKRLVKIQDESLKIMDDGNKETIGIVLNALLDPESNINKADRIIAEKEIKTF